MKLLALSALLATCVLASPIAEPNTYVSPEGLKVRGLNNQGEGFYLALFDENGEADVQFTPLAALNQTVLDDYAKQTAEASAIAARSALLKRGTTCRGTGWTPDMDYANVQLARNGDGRWYNKHAWGWVHYESATSYFCNYQAQTLAYDLLIQFQIWVSNDCGGSHKYGWHRCTNACGINDLAVGRTFRGDEFCASGFKG